MAKRKKKGRVVERNVFTRHPDDKGIDEILFVAPVPERVVPRDYDEALRHAFLKLAVVERYKTSGLSGDEWRFSAALYMREQHREDWRMISSGYGRLEWATHHIYPELYGDLQTGKWTMDDLLGRKVGAITFGWKGHPIYSASYDGQPTDLLVAAGHLPLAWSQAGDQGCPTEPLNRLCCQPGCREPHVSVYRLLNRFCYAGHKSNATSSIKTQDGITHVSNSVRGFCQKHLRRGDCGLDDADANYVLVSGPGPKGNEPDPSVVKEALQAPPIHLDPEDLLG